MKKSLVVTIVLLVIVLITACSSTDQNAAAVTSASPQAQGAAEEPVVQGFENQSSLSTDYENALPAVNQLAVGIIKIGDSGYPLSAEQADELRLLWKAALSLDESETTATAEAQAILIQIEEVLTPEQVEAVAEMQLTKEDMAALSQELGLSFGAGGSFGRDISPEMQATLQAARESGQKPEGFGKQGGGTGAGGSGAGGGGEISPEVRETAIAERGVVGRGTGSLNVELINVVIEYLEGLD